MFRKIIYSDFASSKIPCSSKFNPTPSKALKDVMLISCGTLLPLPQG
jgi:hypothetical protein